MSDNQWLQELKVEDEVYISAQFSGVPTKANVVRLTSKQIMVGRTNSFGKEFEIKFWKKNGYMVSGNIWTSRRLLKPSKEIINELAIDKLRRQAKAMINELVLPQTKAELESLISALKPFIKETTK